jgi:hypothetical protein
MKPFETSAVDSSMDLSRSSTSPSNNSCVAGMLSDVLTTTFDERFMALVRTLQIIRNKWLQQGLSILGV